MTTTSASNPRQRGKSNHYITSIHFGVNRRVACRCGARLKGFDTDEKMASAYQKHRADHGCVRRNLSDSAFASGGDLTYQIVS